ncbi:uncharacterized protein L199_001550 [Kwoniella botswanensis]|uniref:uncharacterized protein n=1 Tax=Kwoniella botswanensis TaxID=1268659 RepID=UPI00315DBDC8
MSFVPPPTSPLTYGYTDHIVHSINKVIIALRVFPATDDGTKRPWLIWVHGGAYIAGKHFNPPLFLLPAFHDQANYHIVTFSHRSLPQISFQDMWDDITFQFHWCLTNLPSFIGEDKIDMDNYGIGGDSSGGHFATSTGFRLSHTSPPKVIISLYGVVNPLDPYFEQESEDGITPDYGTPPNVLTRMLEDREKSRARIFAPWNWEMPPTLTPEQLEAYWGYKYEITEEDKRRMDLNNRIHQKGMRMNLLFREETFIWKERYVERVKKWTVPVERSKRFAEGLKKKGVVAKEIYPEGKGHTFDYVITEYIQPLISFVKIHLEE